MLEGYKIVAIAQKQGLEVATYAAYDYESFLNMFDVNDYEPLRYVRIESNERKIKIARELKEYCKMQLFLEKNAIPNLSEVHQVTVDEWIKTIPNY